jgi:hypothetical protein
MNRVSRWFVAVFLALAALSAQSASADSVQVAAVDWKSFERVGNHARIWLLRSFRETTLLGHDLYPHRSQRVQYVIDCTDHSYALSQWILTDGENGAGAVVWADRNEELDFVRAAKGTLEAAVIHAGCSIDAPTSVAQQPERILPDSSPLLN